MIIDVLSTQSVTVETYTGEGVNGHLFAAPVTVPCYVEEVIRAVTTAAGEERTAGRQSALQFSTTVVRASLDYDALFPTGSRVTLPSGFVGRVQQRNTFKAGVFADADHIEVHVI